MMKNVMKVKFYFLSFYRHNPAGDTGEPYVHDTTGDFGPFYYWKLRQQVDHLVPTHSHLLSLNRHGRSKRGAAVSPNLNLSLKLKLSLSLVRPRGRL